MLDDEVFTRLVAAQAASDSPGSAIARTRGNLTVFSTIGLCYLLTGWGDVLVHTDADAVSRLADPEEREFGHVQAARRFPELAHLAPPRPESALTCKLCVGSGELLVNGLERPICCPHCNTRGWV